MHSIHPVHVFKGIKWRTLVALARVHRRRLGDVPFIGITGSCAKTTTKTLLAGILSERYPVAFNPGSKNRTEAMAKTILKAKKNGICIQELAASSIGSLDAMLQVFRPTVAVITNVMRDHFTAFRSLDAIAIEKSKLVSALPRTGTAVLNADDPRVAGMRDLAKGKTLTYGLSSGADLRGIGFHSEWPGYLKGEVIWKNEHYPVATRLVGEHWTSALLAAIAGALSLGLDMKDIVPSVSRIEPEEGRYSIEYLPNGATVICDDFKSPMHSIAPALAFMQSANADRKIMVFGQISDYSGSSSRKYKRVATQAMTVCDKVVLMNRFASARLEGLGPQGCQRVHSFQNIEAAKDFLLNDLRPGDLMFLKGIRKMDHLERLVMVFRRSIACWRSNCARQMHCRDCDRLGRAMPSLVRTDAANTPSMDHPEDS